MDDMSLIEDDSDNMPTLTRNGEDNFDDISYIEPCPLRNTFDDIFWRRIKAIRFTSHWILPSDA